MEDVFTNETCAVVQDVTETLALVVHHSEHVPEDVAWVPHAVVIAVSLVLLAQGYKVIRPTSALIGFVFGFAVIFIYGDEMECMWRIIISGLVGLCTSCAIFCLLKSGIFVIGATGFGVSTHFLYESLPIEWPDEIPSFRDKSVVYWGSMAVAVVGGAVAVHRGRKRVMMVVSSLIGGVGLAIGLEGMLDAPDVSLLVWLLIGAVAAVSGTALQFYLDKREHRIKEEKKKKSYSPPNT